MRVKFIMESIENIAVSGLGAGVETDLYNPNFFTLDIHSSVADNEFYSGPVWNYIPPVNQTYDDVTSFNLM